MAGRSPIWFRVRVGEETVPRQALELAGVEFIPENGSGAGVRLRERS